MRAGRICRRDPVGLVGGLFQGTGKGTEMATPKDLKKDLDRGESELRQIMIDILDDEEFLRIARQGPAFHDTLVRAQHNGWVHYTRLAQELESSSSQVNRWFKPSDDDSASSRSTPNKFVIDAALKALKKILIEDQKRLKKAERPIGGDGVGRIRLVE